MEISKEVLGEVLGVNNISSIIYDIDFPNIIEYNQYATLARGMRSTEINIYEFASRCKEWASELGYEMESATYRNKEGGYCFVSTFFDNTRFEARAEVEATIKACEYILKELNEKQLQH